MSTSFYSEEELVSLGLNSIGRDVSISRKASLYGASNISVGSHVRIDDFCILSGHITIGDYVHIAAGVMLFGGNAGIDVQDFAGVSSRSAIYAESDDYSGKHMVNPTVPMDYRGVISEHVVLSRHSLLGTGSTILPGVTIGEGSATGAMTLVSKSLEPWGVYVGVPARRLRDRAKDVLLLEKQFLSSQSDEGARA